MKKGKLRSIYNIRGVNQHQGAKAAYAKALLEKRKSTKEKKENTEWQQ
jgi:hypothetical protein